MEAEAAEAAAQAKKRKGQAMNGNPEDTISLCDATMNAAKAHPLNPAPAGTLVQYRHPAAIALLRKEPYWAEADEECRRLGGVGRYGGIVTIPYRKATGEDLGP